MTHLATSLVLRYSTAYKRRILDVLERFPMLMMGLKSKRAPEVARLILDSNPIEITTGKVRLHFRHELDALVRGEVPCPRLQRWIDGFSTHIAVDADACEGLNSIMKDTARKIPNINLELLSTRVTLKKALILPRQTRRTWKVVQPRALDLLETWLL